MDGLHWVVWNVPAASGGIPEGPVTGRNVEDKNAFLGPLDKAAYVGRFKRAR